MKVDELEGARLDYWVARATGKGCWDWSDGAKVTFADWQKHHSLHTRFTSHSMEAFRPSADWAQGGPIIEREVIGFGTPISDLGYQAFLHKESGVVVAWGQTHLIAAMRVYVKSKFGDEAPDE